MAKKFIGLSKIDYMEVKTIDLTKSDILHLYTCLSAVSLNYIGKKTDYPLEIDELPSVQKKLLNVILEFQSEEEINKQLR
jgi:hypothetical protein